jgi:hypothetical protein
MRLGQTASTVLEHLDKPGLIQRRIGVWRADKSGDTARHCRLHLRL